MVIRGLVSGFILYIALSMLDLLFQTNTVRLLLNIDFITHQESMPIFLEVGLHLVVSVVIYILLYKLFYNRTLYYAAYVVLMIIFTILYFILGNISRTVSFDLNAELYIAWMLGHIIYLLVTHLFISHTSN